MKKDMITGVVVGLMAGLAACGLVRGAEAMVLFDFAPGFDVGSVEASDANISLTAGGALSGQTRRGQPWPGVTLKAPAGKWDLSAYNYLSLDVANLGAERLTLNCRVDNPGADGAKNCVTDSLTLEPGKSAALTVQIFPGPW